MKQIILIAIIALASSISNANTLVKCVVPNPRNVLIIDIDESHLTGLLTELNGKTTRLESSDGMNFNKLDSEGMISLTPGVYTSPASRTHAILIDQNGNKTVVACIKRNMPAPLQTLVTNNQLTGYEACQVSIPNYGNPHRNYDAKFRACRAKAIELGFIAEEAKACTWTCMKN